MENLAGAHSEYVNFSYKDLVKDDLTWVLLNWKLQVFYRPLLNTNLIVKTWGNFFNKAYVIRDFKIYDENNTLCAIASSKWCMVNTKKQRIAKLPENLDEIYYGFNEESVFKIKDIPKIKEPTKDPLNMDTYRIHRLDLDVNKHVHNLNYLNMAYEVLPDEVFNNLEFENVEIMYKKELKYGDMAKLYMYNDDSIYTVVIKSNDEDTTSAIVKLW